MTTEEKTEKPNHEIVNIRTAHSGWARFMVASVRSPDGRTVEREIEDHGEAVCVLPYDPVRKTAVLVKQLRAPVLFAANEEETLEAIAGIIEHEDPLACVRRETLEEAQLELGSVEHIVTAWTMPGLSTERMHFHLAVYAGDPRPAVRGGLAHEHEATTAVEIGLADLARMADANELNDVKTLLLVQTLRLRQPRLFQP